MSDREHLREIDQVLNGRASGRDAVVAQSWRRCVEQYGLDPAKPSPAHIVEASRLREHREQSERLIAIARSGLQALFRQIAGQNYVLLLADAKGVTVDFFGDPRFEDELRRAGLYLGSDWSEDLAGTCGVGSCITTREAVTIHQTDHFDMTHTPLSCTAAPIFDTVGELTAVLDISLLRSPQPKISQTLALNLVKTSARRVEMANLMAMHRGEWVLRFSSSPELLDVDPDAAVALDGSGRIIGMTRGAGEALSRQGGPVLGAPIEQFFELGIDNLPDLMRGVPTEDRVIGLRDGQAAFGHAIAPQRPRKARALPDSGLPAALRSLAGSDPAMSVLLDRAARLAPTRLPLLIRGETGTGKDRLARAIHDCDVRPRPFMAVNCIGAPGFDTLPEGGTLFLDNLHDLDPEGQARLLCLLDRIAACPARQRPRIIAAASADPGVAVQAGRFRQDLFFRIATATLDVPPLRRRTDFDWLLDRVLRMAAHHRPGSFRLSPAARAELKSRDWPGNLRELAGVLEAALVQAEGSVIDLPDLPPPALAPAACGPQPCGAGKEIAAGAPPPLADVLEACNGNMSLAARRLGVNRSTVLRRARRAGLRPA
jgi:transcriptional regulator of acetoin/glycerol metabolism